MAFQGEFYLHSQLQFEAPFHISLARLVSGLRADAARQALGLHSAVVEIHRLAQAGARRKKT
jgi:hypothetical protein